MVVLMLEEWLMIKKSKNIYAQLVHKVLNLKKKHGCINIGGMVVIIKEYPWPTLA